MLWHGITNCFYRILVSITFNNSIHYFMLSTETVYDVETAKRRSRWLHFCGCFVCFHVCLRVMMICICLRVQVFFLCQNWVWLLNTWPYTHTYTCWIIYINFYLYCGINLLLKLDYTNWFGGSNYIDRPFLIEINLNRTFSCL